MKIKTRAIVNLVMRGLLLGLTSVMAVTAFSAQGVLAGSGWLMAALLLLAYLAESVLQLVAACKIEKIVGQAVAAGTEVQEQASTLQQQMMMLWEGLPLDAFRTEPANAAEMDKAIEVGSNFGELPKPEPDRVTETVKAAHKRVEEFRGKLQEKKEE